MIQGSKDGYPELEEKKEFIFNVLNNEEKQFNKTIDQGLRILSDLEEKMAASGEKTLSGEDAFRLYDTYGFPMDLTREILQEKGYAIDEEGFAASMKEQQERARNARETTNYMGADATVYDLIDPSVTTRLCGLRPSDLGVSRDGPHRGDGAEGFPDGRRKGHYPGTGDAFLRHHGRPGGRYRRDPGRQTASLKCRTPFISGAAATAMWA